MDFREKRIGVLMGGVSSEREVSLKSGKAVFEALKSCRVDAVAIDVRKPDKKYVKDLLLSYDLDLAFLALHGVFGEDGKIQRILEEIGLVFTGSGPQASALAMDKIAAHEIFKKAGLNVPECRVLNSCQQKIIDFEKFPLVVKPACGGSSIGLSIVDNPKGLRKAVAIAFKYGRKAMVEEYIEGREMTVGIFADRPLPPIEIKPKARFFDYKAKYEKGKTAYIVPAEISQVVSSSLGEAALQAHKFLGCSFFSRVDIILSKGNKPFVLEINTIPGFTATSLLPMAARIEGIDFPDLILKISESALMKQNLIRFPADVDIESAPRERESLLVCNGQ